MRYSLPMLPCLSLLCFMVFGPPAVALGETAGVATAPATSVQAFGLAHPQCLAWSDTCVTCTAGGSKAQCSTPGIACTPGPVSCQQPRP